MFIRFIVLLNFTVLLSFATDAQGLKNIADSIRRTYQIPELNYAVVSSDSIYEMEALGFKKLQPGLAAALTDKFRIGSNTKAITSFIAALMVEQKQILWNTKFFDLFPELKITSNKAYHAITLQQLLTFRSNLIPYTYTNEIPTKNQFFGSEDEQRYQFAAWFFKQQPVIKKGINFTNLGYVAAGLMLEKASAKTYKQLVKELGNKLGIDFNFGNPNALDSLQTWGHFNNNILDSSKENYKLNWLLAAGNINVNIIDYVKFIQLQLLGLYGKSSLFAKQKFEFLHYGLPQFSFGWFNEINAKGHYVSYNIGNPGSFITEVFIIKAIDKAYILFANSQNEKTDTGLKVLLQKIKERYGE